MAQHDSAPVERTQTLAARLGRFHLRMLAGFGLAVIAASILESDRRGLLFYEEPTAFAASMPEYSAGLLTYGGGITGMRGSAPPRGSARRFITGRPGTDGASSQPAEGGGVPALVLDNPGAAIGEIGPPGTFTLASAGPGDGGGPVVPGPGFAPSPIGGIVVLPPGPGNPDPEVPAVPEPSSWILMILGVGLLGAALRRSATAGRSLRAAAGPLGGAFGTEGNPNPA